jgi:putative transposase
MRMTDEQFLETPWYGSRQMARWLRREGYRVGRKRVVRLIRKMGLTPVYQKPSISKLQPGHKIYPYLLRGVEITEPGHVWCADITYIPMRRGFLYLVAIMDWASRKVLSWRLSNTLEADFCVAALREALLRFLKPLIFNTDQGSQFTSLDFTKVLKAADIKISMDGKGRWMDNVMIERLWRSLKYECVYLHAFETGSEARKGNRKLDGLLQPTAAPLQPGRQNTGRSILGSAQGGTERGGGMRTTKAIHLNYAAELSNKWGPPLGGKLSFYKKKVNDLPPSKEK